MIDRNVRVSGLVIKISKIQMMGSLTKIPTQNLTIK